MEILERNLVDILDEVALIQRQAVLFQQDGAPSHNARQVYQYLNEKFPGRWIGTHGPLLWPARSPDLSPLDFFLWGFLKSIIYKTPANNLNVLINNIHNAFRQIKPLHIINAIRSVRSRCQRCLNSNGGYFEHL